MSLYGIMRTGVSGMNAQANRLSSVAENVANVNTTGYKRSSAEFSTLLLSHCAIGHESGAVDTVIRYHVSTQGSLLNTSSVTDLAIGGRGFLLVSNNEGQPFLTRAGSFVPDENGTLVNAAGFRLMGYRLDPDQPGVTVNGFTNLEAINLESLSLTASASTSGTFVANLPADAQIIPAADLPSTNAAGSQFTAKSSLISYDSLGREIVLDLYYSKTGDNAWELAVYNQQDADPSGGFPYAAAALATMPLTFDPSTGNLDVASATAIDIPVPGGATLALDVSKTSQLATDYVVLTAKVNGNAPGGAELIDIARDGTVYATYESGTRIPVFRIPLAHVVSPDMLTPLAGNVYLPSPDSGDIQVGFAQTGGLGDVISGALEQSTVDLASELTAMIDAQRSYSANSKVFQTGSELMDVLVNLKR